MDKEPILRISINLIGTGQQQPVMMDSSKGNAEWLNLIIQVTT